MGDELAAIVERDAAKNWPDECEDCHEYATTAAMRDRRYLLGLLREAQQALGHELEYTEKDYSHVECGAEEEIRNRLLLARLGPLG